MMNIQVLPILRIFQAFLMIFLFTGSVLAQEALAPAKSGYAPVNGQKVYYEVYGSGKPVVLLHGSFMNIAMNWSELIPVFSKDHQVIAIELQGHGHTPDSDRPFAYNTLANDVAGVIRHLGLEKADVIGYSFGGTVAYELAIAHPEVVNKLIVISSTFKYHGWQPAVHDVMKSLQPEFLDQTPLKAEYDKVAPDPSHWHAFVGKLLAFDTKDFDLGKERVAKISCPVLLIGGDNDGVDLVHLVETYRLLGGNVFADMTGLPRSQLAIVPASTHVGLMMKTKELSDLILPFLQ